MDSDRAGRKRAAILATAARVFAEKGYHAAGISDIAKALKMGHGTFYRYFSNKLDIFRAVIAEVITRVQEVIASEDPAATRTLAEYRAQVVRLGHKLFAVFEENEHLANLLFLEASGVDREHRERVAEVTDLFGQYTALYLQNGVAKGFLRADLDVPVTALAMNAMVFEGLRRLAPAKDRRAETEKWIAAFCAIVFDGISRKS
jgi:AcrR family transcriptional regulator